MIRLSLGKIGSGKSLSEIREMYCDPSPMIYYTNMESKLKNTRTISSDMIIKKEVTKTTKKRNGEVVDTVKRTLNKDFWKGIDEPISVVLDEAHQFLHARASMTKTNRIVNQWISMLRRVLGQATHGYGDLVLISQDLYALDVFARRMSVQIRYHVCHYTKFCRHCGSGWTENSEMPESYRQCIVCGKTDLYRKNFRIAIYFFDHPDRLLDWLDGLHYSKCCYKQPMIIPNPEFYFNKYNTLQWENMFEDEYS